MTESHLDGLLDELVNAEPREGWDDVLRRARRSRRHYTAVVLVVVALVLVPTTWAAVRAVQGGPGCVTSQYRSLLLISTRTGRVDSSFPDTANIGNRGSAQPLSVATDGHGGWFISGGFACVGTAHVNGFAHLKPDGRLDPSWQAQFPQGRIGGVIRSGDTLFVSGRGEGNRLWLAALDANTGARRWVDYQGFTTFAVNRSWLFAGRPAIGSKSVVALDRRTGAALPWHASLPARFARKRVGVRLTLGSKRLFISVVTPDLAQAGIFALDARTGHLTGWRVPQIKFANVDFVSHGLVFASNLSGTYVARARTGRPVTAFGNPGFYAYDLLGNTLYIGLRSGNPTIQGQTRTLAAVDLRSLKVTSWAPKIKGYLDSPQALAADRKQVLVSGPFFRVRSRSGG